MKKLWLPTKIFRGAFMSLAPIIIPILLMALGSISNMAKWTGFFADVCVFLGTPVIALAVGVIFAVAQLISSGKTGEFYELTNETLKVSGPILFVTAAGGVLGKVIAVSGMVQYITANAGILETIGIFFPFLLSAILKIGSGFLPPLPLQQPQALLHRSWAYSALIPRCLPPLPLWQSAQALW